MSGEQAFAGFTYGPALKQRTQLYILYHLFFILNGLKLEYLSFDMYQYIRYATLFSGDY